MKKLVIPTHENKIFKNKCYPFLTFAFYDTVCLSFFLKIYFSTYLFLITLHTIKYFTGKLNFFIIILQSHILEKFIIQDNIFQRKKKLRKWAK